MYTLDPEHATTICILIKQANLMSRELLTHQSGCVCRALSVFVGPMSSLHCEMAFSLAKASAIIGPLLM